MDLQAEMFLEVEDWIESGDRKADFLSDKSYSEAKFNYWLAKWKSSQKPTKQSGLFQEVYFQEVPLGKELEVEAPSGGEINSFCMSLFGFDGAAKVFIFAKPTDMRKGFDGLYGLVFNEMELDPRLGYLFVFMNKNRNLIKILYWKSLSSLSKILCLS